MKGIAARGELRHNLGHVIDLAPTILELAGGKWPAEWNGQKVPPPPGKSLVAAFAKDGTGSRDCLWWLHENNRAIRVGDWKLVAAREGAWELYDLKTDRAESKNLAAEQPEKARELEELWKQRWDEYRALAAKDAPAEGTPPKKKKGRTD